MSGEGGKASFVDRALGFVMAHYLKLVRRSNRFVVEPRDLDLSAAIYHPAIIAMWHGQHLMMPFARAPSIARVYAMVSRHRDAGFQATALRWFRIEPIRGSGARGDRVREKGGAKALIGLKRLIDGGATVAMTADVPKVARVAGLGIVTLARISGRPIVPIAVVTSRRFDFNSWDRASVGLPFGRGAIVVGEPIHVPADADDAAMEAARLAVQSALDAAHARAYAPRRRRRPGRRPAPPRRGGRAGMTLSLGAYRLATGAAAPFAGALLSLRLNRGKEDPDRLDERLGVAGRERPQGPLVWLHGASVGETRVAAAAGRAADAGRPQRARHLGHADLGAADGAAAAAAGAAPVRAARRAAVRPPLLRPLAPRPRPVRRERDLAEHDPRGGRARRWRWSTRG